MQMRPEDLQLALRPRSRWEAIELGTMLVRRHAGAVWRPWLALSVPVFALVNALFWWLDQLWLAGLALWWWLPVFDRIPLYVLSRAVFGHTPGVMQALRALPDWRRGRLVAHLLWRRLNPWRMLGLPVDLLEEGSPAAKRARRRQIIRGQRGHGLLLAGLCVQFVLVLMLGVVMGVSLFVPTELLSPSAQALWTPPMLASPRWAQVAMNAVWWLALSVIEPFHVGAGFGLYLNRRVHLEGWDIELALRRLRARLGRGAGAVLLAACVLLPGVAAAQAGGGAPAVEADAADERRTLADIFADEPALDVHAFIQSVEDAGRDPLLNQQQTRRSWIRVSQAEPATSQSPFQWQFSAALAQFSERALWVLVAGLAVLLILTAPRWWPWMRRAARAGVRERIPGSSVTALSEEAALPPDLHARARALWQAGARREALALLYRGSLAALAGHPDVTLPASATEAECLRLSRHLPESEQRAAFVQLVQVWQRAAYAGRWPEDTEFDALGGELAQRLRWPT